MPFEERHHPINLHPRRDRFALLPGADPADVDDFSAQGDRRVEGRQSAIEVGVPVAHVERIGRPVDDGHHRGTGRVEGLTAQDERCGGVAGRLGAHGVIVARQGIPQGPRVLRHAPPIGQEHARNGMIDNESPIWRRVTH